MTPIHYSSSGRLINLLPLRKTARAMVIKRFGVYIGLGVIVVSIIGWCMHYNVSQRLHKPVKHSVIDGRKKFEEKYKQLTVHIAQESLDSLHFIGLIKNSVKTWALISQSNGFVSIVAIGDYLGKEHGRVVDIKHDVIDIEVAMWTMHGVEKKWVLLSLRS